MSFLDIWIKIIKKNQAIWIKGKNNKSHTSWQKNQCLGKKKRKGSVLVVLAQNLFYYWCLFYTNPSSEISIENYCENKCQN